MRKVARVFAVRTAGEYLSECGQNVQSVECISAAIFVGTKAQRITGTTTTDRVETKSASLFAASGAPSVELNSLPSPRAAAENRHARSGNCLERGFKQRGRKYVQVQSSSVAQTACNFGLCGCHPIGYRGSDHFALAGVALARASGGVVSLRGHD
ncbi:MAG TPA: hypothetical protein VN902_08580 [Candidatus Acidoferrales bacterium]|jgi:hypothetical protein|nr:hypothetical protein [Candidatus Acidoferrales bacterium]